MPFDGSRRETVASRLREFYGPNGEKWCRWIQDDGFGHFCLMGAFYHQAQDLLDYRSFWRLSVQAIDRVDPEKKRITVLGHVRGEGQSGYYPESSSDLSSTVANYNNAAES
jgi:hypothetical protein